jgi:hypothetical protein
VVPPHESAKIRGPITVLERRKRMTNGKKRILVAAILCAGVVSLARAGKDDPKEVFVAFMETVKKDSIKGAIKKYGVDERKDKSLFAAKLPGELDYEVKDVDEKSNKNEATIKAEIEYTKATEKVGNKVDGATDKASTASKAASGNVVGAAGNVAKNSAADAVGGVGLDRAKKVKMTNKDGKWLVVVTDDFYNVLIGK